MDWPRMLAYVTQELLLRNEYLAAENRILRDQIKRRLLLSESQRLRWPRSFTGWVERLWRTWRQPPIPIRFGAGIGSSSQTSLTDRRFTDESVDRELMRKRNGGLCKWRKIIRTGLRSHCRRVGELKFVRWTAAGRVFDHMAWPNATAPLVWTRLAGYRSRDDSVRKNAAGVAMRSRVRFATAWVKCLVLCVSNQSGLLAIAERTTGTSAACRMRCRLSSPLRKSDRG